MWAIMINYHNYEVMIQGINIGQTRTKTHCRVGGRRGVSKAVWFEEGTAVINNNSCH